MKQELSGSLSELVSAHPIDHLPCIVIFVAGEQSSVVAALQSARRLYPDRRFVFVCEPAHRPWISHSPGERIFVVEQPFNPFGRRASELRRSLESAPIEACALVIADIGFESFRFRVYALRLQTQRFLLLGGDQLDDSKYLNRFSFALLAGAAPFLGRLRKIERRTLFLFGRIVAWIREPQDPMPRAYRFISALVFRAYDCSIGAWLRDVREAYDRASEELEALREEALTQAVEVQRLNGIERVGAGSVKHRITSTVASLGIRYLDKRYRVIFQDLSHEPWERWFGSRNFSNEAITLVIGTLGPGGSERQAVATLLGLASSGYRDLSLLCNYLGSPIDRFFAHLLEGCPVSIAKIREDFSDDDRQNVDGLACTALRVLEEKLPSELKDIPLYAREFLERRPKVVHTWLDYTNVKAGLAAAIIGIPQIILSTRSVAPNNFALFQPYMREVYRLLAARSNVCLLNNSEAGARDYERWLNLPRGTFKVVRNGFDFSALEPTEKKEDAKRFRTRLGIPAEIPLVGSVLRFSEEKCPLRWIDVAACISKRRPDVRFVMIGDGPLRERARQRAAACGLGDRIVMPGNEKDTAVAIAAMDVFLLTSRLEGFPNVLVEAQALGVPVVTTDGGGAAETLIQGKTGYAISPHSADLLADGILRILSDTPWREAARQAAQSFVRDRFSMSLMVDRTLDAYFARGEFAPDAGDVSADPRHSGSNILTAGVKHGSSRKTF
jgi:glycosyltransferase involved in cell wall biosynthesis